MKKDLLDLIRDEVNVKEIVFGKEIKLDTDITQELREEGMVRELTRMVQDMRRDLGLKPKNVIRLRLAGSAVLESVFEKWDDQIKKEVNAREIKIGGKKIFRIERETEISGEKIWIGIS